MSKLNPSYGDPCPYSLCGTAVQGPMNAPRDRQAGLLLHLQTVHYPDRTIEELAARLPELHATHTIRWGGDPV